MKMKSLFLATSLVMSMNAVAQDPTFTLRSNDIREGERLKQAQIFNGFGCQGENISPQLNWSNAPKGTQSFAITAYDPDAPTDSGWYHWVVIDIPGNVSTLASGAGSDIKTLPAGSRGIINDFSTKTYGGACPPAGLSAHRYQFTVWALPTAKLDVPDQASAALVSFMLRQQAIGKARITAVYNH